MPHITHTHDTKQVVERYVSILQAGDGEALRDMFSPDATWRMAGELPMSGTWAGRDTILDDFLAGALGSYRPGSIAIEVTGLVADGETAVLEWTTRAVTRAGAQYENECIGVFTVRDGQIQSVREYMDTGYAQRMLYPERIARVER